MRPALDLARLRAARDVLAALPEPTAEEEEGPLASRLATEWGPKIDAD